MVLEFKGYNPTEVGLRKFLTETEAEILECLWEIGDKGGCCKEIRDRLALKGCSHSNATIIRTLKSLEAKGVAASRVVTHSPSQLVYSTKTNREKAQAILVERVISNLNASMPEALAHAVKKLKP